MDICDLHTHSTFSDGTFSPSRIVAEGLRVNLRAVALTDHNTVAGLPEFLDAARGTALEAIPGVEISTGYLEKEVHIVGLFLEQEMYAPLEDFLGVINRRKEEAIRALVAALRTAGYELSYGEIRERHPGNVNRAVIAAELVKQGYVREIKEAFRGVLSPKHGFYTPPERVPALEAVRFLHSIHAVPVLAHPFLSLTEGELRAFLAEGKEYGLAAMETRYSTYSAPVTAAARAIAEEFGLLESGGSDFHGENKPDIRLGTGTGDLTVPYGFAEKLSAWKESRMESRKGIE